MNHSKLFIEFPLLVSNRNPALPWTTFSAGTVPAAHIVQFVCGCHLNQIFNAQ
jgi:hypothetical protein